MSFGDFPGVDSLLGVDSLDVFGTAPVTSWVGLTLGFGNWKWWKLSAGEGFVLLLGMNAGWDDEWEYRGFLAGIGMGGVLPSSGDESYSLM